MENKTEITTCAVAGLLNGGRPCMGTSRLKTGLRGKQDTFDSQSLIDLIFRSITSGFIRIPDVLSVLRKSPAERYQEGVAKGRALGTKLVAELLQEISRSGPVVNPVHRFYERPYNCESRN